MTALNYDAVYKKLNVEVTHIAGPASKQVISDTPFRSNFKIRQEYLYALIPLLFIIILSAIRPEFVTYNYLPEGAEENTVPVVKLSFKDVLTWAFGLTIPVAIGIYIYTTKQGI